ncbi:MAG: 16S rRNA (guanine(966)-N(2))-methyltransferase RsmD [Actinomycetes bacterium]|jgi:16S rRNA (guanine966-N2)-methyltransferase|nr:16S rRNA (guanine(966)-N(2))-methyltransferase RsmD [Actinomycetes bacterium]
MRIIAGIHKGRRLLSPAGDGTRPTSDRVREAVFSTLVSLGHPPAGAVVLDAFAGSGALGLEALSRGADRLCAIERDRDTYSVLRQNAETVSVDGRCRTHRANAYTLPLNDSYDLVFLDPPYAHSAEKIAALIEWWDERGALSADCLVVYEHAGEYELSAEFRCGFRVVARRAYGTTAVSYLKRAAATGGRAADADDDACGKERAHD